MIGIYRIYGISLLTRFVSVSMLYHTPRFVSILFSIFLLPERIFYLSSTCDPFFTHHWDYCNRSAS